MPRVATLRSGAAIYIYADDHAPPHFHLRGPESNAMIDMGSLEVMAGACTRSDLAEALDWAREHAVLLAAKWSEYNERD